MLIAQGKTSKEIADALIITERTADTHAAHIRAKIDCATCHGDMTQATTAERLVKHTMGTCLSCHRQYKASEDCATCHF